MSGSIRYGNEIKEFFSRGLLFRIEGTMINKLSPLISVNHK
jgi:hypothetical protein